MQLTNELNETNVNSLNQTKKIVKAARTLSRFFKGKNLQANVLGNAKSMNLDVPNEVAKSEEFDSFVDNNISAVNEIIIETQKKLNFFQKIKNFFMGLRQKRLPAGKAEVTPSPAQIAKDRMKKVLANDEATFANERVIVPQNLDFSKAQVSENTNNQVATFKFLGEKDFKEKSVIENLKDEANNSNKGPEINNDDDRYIQGQLIVKIDDSSLNKIISYCQEKGIEVPKDKNKMRIVLTTGKMYEIDEKYLDEMNFSINGYGSDLFVDALSVKLPDEIQSLYKLKGQPCIVTNFKTVNGIKPTIQNAERLQFNEIEELNGLTGSVVYSIINQQIDNNEEFRARVDKAVATRRKAREEDKKIVEEHKRHQAQIEVAKERERKEKEQKLRERIDRNIEAQLFGTSRARRRKKIDRDDI